MNFKSLRTNQELLQTINSEITTLAIWLVGLYTTVIYFVNHVCSYTSRKITVGSCSTNSFSKIFYYFCMTTYTVVLLLYTKYKNGREKQQQSCTRFTVSWHNSVAKTWFNACKTSDRRTPKREEDGWSFSIIWLYSPLFIDNNAFLYFCAKYNGCKNGFYFILYFFLVIMFTSPPAAWEEVFV